VQRYDAALHQNLTCVACSADIEIAQHERRVIFSKTASSFADVPYRTDPGLRTRPPTRATSAARSQSACSPGMLGIGVKCHIYWPTRPRSSHHGGRCVDSDYFDQRPVCSAQCAV